jgi:hypothetical protein
VSQDYQDRDRRTHSFEDFMMRTTRELGTMDARLSSLERRLDERLSIQAQELAQLRQDSKQTNEKLDEVLRLVDRGKTSWKTLTIIATSITAFFTFLVWLAEKVQTFSS